MQETGWVSPLDAAIREAYVLERKSMDAIGDAHNLSRADVRRRLVRMGVTIRPRSEIGRGRKPSAETRRKIAESNTGKRQTPERRKAHSEFMKGLLARERNPNWRGGVKYDSCGYKMILCPEHPRANNMGYVREHILVMEEVLDRPIVPNEVVHHINGIKDDNRPENLMVFRDGADHRKWHAYFNRQNRIAASMQPE